MDMFRRQDRDRDGRVSRKEFIDGIIATSKFNSCKKCQFFHLLFFRHSKKQ